MIHLRPLCCDCGDYAVASPGDRCLECAEFLAEATRPGWDEDEPYVPSRGDILRDRDEEARCYEP